MWSLASPAATGLLLVQVALLPRRLAQSRDSYDKLGPRKASHRFFRQSTLIRQATLLQGSRIQQGASNAESRQTIAPPPPFLQSMILTMTQAVAYSLQAQLVQLQNFATPGRLPGLGQEPRP